MNEVRVGSSTDGLSPVSVAQRSLGADARQWGGLALVAAAAIAADQVTKYVVTSTVSLDDSVHVAGPLSIHHVQNTGIAFGLFSGATAVVVVVTARAKGVSENAIARQSGGRRMGENRPGSPATRLS